MPIISRFFGIIIYMFWRDHAPPHFHAKYCDSEITVEISTGKIIGKMTPRAIGLVQEWRELHKDELMMDWKRAEERKSLIKIQPLE